MRDILLFQRSRFRDFAPRERIATNILTDRLGRLEKARIITKVRDEKLKNQYIYAATNKGWRLLPAIVEIMLWGLQHDPVTPACKSYLKRINTEREIVTHEVMCAARQGRFLEYRQKEMGIQG